MKIYAFADEADAKIDGQIAAMKHNCLNGLEIRGVDGENISDITPEKAKEVRKKLEDNGLIVWSLGSPIGKIKIEDDFAAHLEKLKHTLEIGNLLGAENIRLFSFYLPEGSDFDAYADEVLNRVGQLTECAVMAGISPCHENEKGIFGDSKIERPAGDAMVLIGAIEPLMEWNVAYDIMNDPKPPCANAGIWPQSTEHCVVQYNEVGYAHKPQGCDDAQGFDVDLSCRNTVIQYNYSHDNAGGFLLLCELPDTSDRGYTGTIVRNNLSVNDGNVKGELMALVGPVRGVTIENNTVYTSGNLKRLIQVWTGNGEDQAKDVTVRNNLFICNGLGNEYVLWNGENFTFENNLYWGEYRTPGPNEKSARVVNPHLPSPVTGRGREIAENYVPPADSAALEFGATPLKPAEKDFFGNPTENRAYIGAFVGGSKK